jgi:hypothetical protein
MTDELMALLKEYFEYATTNFHTSFPGVVVSYNSKTRRADIQPSIKRHMPDGSFMAFPVLANVPVIFQGTKKYTIHFPLEEGEEVEVRVGERSTGIWRGKGGKDIEDPDPRRFDLNDCYCTPGLQPVEFIAAEEPGLTIIHKTGYDGDFVSSLTMDDDKVQVKYKKKAEVLLEDDRIAAKTEKCKVDLTADVAQLANSKLTFKLNSEKFSINNGSKSFFTIIDTLLQTMITTTPTTLGSPAAHNWNPGIAQALSTAKADVNALLEA